MALMSRRSAGQCLPMIAAVVILGVGQGASAAEPELPAASGSPDHPAAVAGGLLLIALVLAGIALTIVGLRDDLRKRRRGYRRRSRRPRAPIHPEEKRTPPT